MLEITAEELEISALENQLKYVMKIRSDTAGKILTSQELNEYQQWMFQNISEKAQPSYIVTDMFRFPNITKKRRFYIIFRLPNLNRHFLPRFTLRAVCPKEKKYYPITTLQ